MSNVDEMKKRMEEIVSSYESRISAVREMVDNTHRILDNFSEKRNAMSMQLKRMFISEKSFCEKEFNKMIKEIFGTQESIENETRILLNIYIDEQKKAANVIRKNFKRYKLDNLVANGEMMKGFRSDITNLQASQRANEEMSDIELRDMLKTIYNKHKMTIEFLQIFMVKASDDKIQYPEIMANNKRTHSEGWWGVFKHIVSQWRGLIAMERQNMYMAQRRILTVPPIIMLDYFKQMGKTGS